jgi:hypothetical protein
LTEGKSYVWGRQRTKTKRCERRVKGDMMSREGRRDSRTESQIEVKKEQGKRRKWTVLR